MISESNKPIVCNPFWWSMNHKHANAFDIFYRNATIDGIRAHTNETDRLRSFWCLRHASTRIYHRSNHFHFSKWNKLNWFLANTRTFLRTRSSVMSVGHTRLHLTTLKYTHLTVTSHESNRYICQSTMTVSQMWNLWSNSGRLKLNWMELYHIEMYFILLSSWTEFNWHYWMWPQTNICLAYHVQAQTWAQ